MQSSDIVQASALRSQRPAISTHRRVRQVLLGLGALSLVSAPAFVLGKNLMSSRMIPATANQDQPVGAATIVVPREPPVDAVPSSSEVEAPANEDSAAATGSSSVKTSWATPATIGSNDSEIAISEITPAVSEGRLRLQRKSRTGFMAVREFSDGKSVWRMGADHKVVKSIVVKSLADTAILGKHIAPRPVLAKARPARDG